MSASVSRAMRSNKILRVSLLAALLGGAQSGADEQGDASVATAPPRAVDRAEYHSQALPNDIFIPNEDVIEDYPIAFPVDI